MAPLVLLMLTMTFAAIDFGRVIWQQEVLTGLTREGSNIASRTTPVNLPAAVTAVTSDGAGLNLTTNGKVIITSVINTVVAGKQMYVITGQAFSSGSYNATSKIGTYVPSGTPPGKNVANLPVETIPGVVPGLDPASGNVIYITEVFDSYSPITPLGAFMKHALPTAIYDVAYF
jgi:hypothetical protein